MPSLRTYRDRIKSVKSTRKITSAMKMVAASKLKKAQSQAQASQPYAQAMAETLARVAKNVNISPASSKLLVGTGSDRKHLLVVMAADRGLCGGFNANLVKEARRMIAELLNEKKEVSVLCVGTKARDILQREYRKLIAHSFTGLTAKVVVSFAEAGQVREYILDKFEAGEYDICTLIYNEFKSVLAQKPKRQQLVPFKLPEPVQSNDNNAEAQAEGPISPYDFEPSEEQILNSLLPRNLGVQIYRALLDSAAGEQAARMTAMDNATRNAGERIKDLTLQYNRARQAFITKELIEIISGAEAL
ncbi:MAG: F0F1 ATP synthase subunit gamma [Alphaproteobacteria bacterium]|nr:F0F1 ATP synthase subunit gamma [Alphaproteobacteria bacterium]